MILTKNIYLCFRYSLETGIIKNTEDTETSEKGMSVCCIKINSVYSAFSVLKNSLVSFKFLRKLKNL